MVSQDLPRVRYVTRCGVFVLVVVFCVCVCVCVFQTADICDVYFLSVPLGPLKEEETTELTVVVFGLAQVETCYSTSHPSKNKPFRCSGCFL